MIDRRTLTLQLFQKSHVLKMTVPFYKKAVSNFLTWCITQDNVKKDQTAAFIPQRFVQAQIISKENIVVAGIEEISTFFGKEITFDIKKTDGEKAEKNEVIASVLGESRALLSSERIILNVLARMSAIATQTKSFVEKLKNPLIAATRKTPLMLLDKKAVAVGGGITHRLDLHDGILIKDNHLEMIKKEYGLRNEAQAVTKALELALSKKLAPTIEIEVNTPEGASTAIKTFCSSKNQWYLTIMFDNWKPEMVKPFMAQEKIPLHIADRILFEASGNITKENIAAWATTPVDFLSIGALTHSVKAADLSMEIK